MVRGHAKQAAQEANAKRQAAMKKSGSQLDAQKAGLKFKCPVCLTEVTNYKMMVQHYECKHPKETCPTEEAVQQVSSHNVMESSAPAG
eukprot:CAMPEP_0178431774 /NCGR_PEP_ID=MMETSP0689_2-20121128/32034_1 /TAXON_ID=160604 /ORGANISM="Amphidinium massartii, Strain CS-259" /LENGTH=87 /DNA_ID=CAMNT_0020053723 /DNA_START=98 /DNA_END=357 /DNA_ORIENTATION=-